MQASCQGRVWILQNSHTSDFRLDTPLRLELCPLQFRISKPFLIMDFLRLRVCNLAVFIWAAL